MTSAVTSAARKLPSSSEQHGDDEQRAFEQVRAHRARWSCRRASCGRRRPRAADPSGSDALISSSFAAAARATTRLFSPISMNTVPSTTSSPFIVAAPVRRSLPIADLGDVADDDRRRRRAWRCGSREISSSDADLARARARDTGCRSARCSRRRRWRCCARAPRTRSASVRPNASSAVGPRRDDVLPLVAADHVDLGDAGHARELRPHDPVHDRVQIGRVVGAAVGAARAGRDAQDEHEDLAQAGRDRAELGLEARRQRRRAPPAGVRATRWRAK